MTVFPYATNWPRIRGRHRAIDEVARLRHQLEGAGHLITGLRIQLEEAHAAEDKANARAVRLDEAEAEADALTAENAQLRADHIDVGVERQQREQAEQQLAGAEEKLRAYRAAEENANAVTVPQVGHRDVDPDDCPTEPVGIDVRALWDQLGTLGADLAEQAGIPTGRLAS
jgi:hypothetical protein